MPRNSLVVITGLSGSGKSSLAFDTIYAEGQRRYVESLSAYARQFLELMQKPDVDSIEGLSPAISIEQKTTSRNPRSTVGTVTEIYDYLRLLFARVGMPYSPATGLPIESQTVRQMVDRIMAMPEGTRLYLLAPDRARPQGRVPQGAGRTCRSAASSASRSTAQLYEIDDVPALNKKLKHDIEVVVDRLVVRAGIRNAPGRQPGDRARPRRRPGVRRDRRGERRKRTGEPERIIFSAALRLPGLRLHHRRDRAAAVLLQQPVRRLPGLRRPRHQACSSIRSWWCRTIELSLARRRHRAVGQLDLASITCRRWTASPSTTSSASTRRGSDLPEKVRDVILYRLRRRRR